MIRKLLKAIGIIVLAVVAVGAGLCAYVVFDNSRVKNTEFTYESEKLPASFDGYKIAVVADFHSSDLYDKTVSAVADAEPDIICIAGDLINSDDTDFSNAAALVRGLTDIAPVYFTDGNHETWSALHAETKDPPVYEELKSTDVIMLNDKTVQLEKDGETIYLTGCDDLQYSDMPEQYGREDFIKYSRESIARLSKNIPDDAFSVLVMHRAQYFEQMCEGKFDLMLTGHLHGGLINIKPIRDYILREHFSTDEYVKWRYEHGEQTMFISAGIAKEMKIPRVFNSPEVMTIVLKSK